jgi:TRAP-type uncharacterized transport system fused permease subunit
MSGMILSVIMLYYYNFSFWKDLLEEKGWLSVLTSKRNELFVQNIPIAIKELSLWHLLFGYPNPFQYFVEMDIVDLILTLGIVGAVFMGFFYKKLLFRFDLDNSFAWFFVIVFIIMITITSRYTYSGTNAITFPLFLYYLRNKNYSIGSSSLSISS